MNSTTTNMTRNIILILLVASAYAITRYVLSGSVDPQNIPVYIANKVLAVSSVFTIMLAAIAYLKDDNIGAKNWGRTAFHISALHVFFSLALLSPEYYQYQFYFWQDVETTRLTIKGELTILFGLLGAYAYLMLFISKHGTKTMAYLKLAATFCTGSHIFIMAFSGWLPWTWGAKFNMPPISLISFVFITIAFLIYLKMKDAKAANAGK